MPKLMFSYIFSKTDLEYYRSEGTEQERKDVFTIEQFIPRLTEMLGFQLKKMYYEGTLKIIIEPSELYDGERWKGNINLMTDEEIQDIKTKSFLKGKLEQINGAK